MTTETEGPLAAADSKPTWTAEVLPGWDALERKAYRCGKLVITSSWLMVVAPALLWLAHYATNSSSLSLWAVALFSTTALIANKVAAATDALGVPAVAALFILLTLAGGIAMDNDTHPGWMLALVVCSWLPLIIRGAGAVWLNSCALAPQDVMLGNWHKERREAEAKLLKPLRHLAHTLDAKHHHGNSNGGVVTLSNRDDTCLLQWEYNAGTQQYAASSDPLESALICSDDVRHHWRLSVTDMHSDPTPLGELSLSCERVFIALLSPGAWMAPWTIAVWREAKNGDVHLQIIQIDRKTKQVLTRSDHSVSQDANLYALLLPGDVSPVLLAASTKGSLLLSGQPNMARTLPAPVLKENPVDYRLIWTDNKAAMLRMQQLDRRTGTAHTAVVPLQFAPSELADVA